MTATGFKYTCRLLSVIIALLSLAMVVPLIWSLVDSLTLEPAPGVVRAFGLAVLVGLITSGLFFLVGRGVPPQLAQLRKREALLLVTVAWLVGSLLAALPYQFWALSHDFTGGTDPAFRSFINCLFESVSGLTTTGASILSDIESLPRGILFWRAFTNWIGGLGIVVIFVVLFPSLGAGTKRLFGVESTGIASEGVSPQIKSMARTLSAIYLIMTVIAILILKLVDPSLSWFHAICHAFTVIATGGYSTFNASAGALNATAQWFVILFIILCGINFGLYHKLINGKFREVIRDDELRFYLIIMAFACLIIYLATPGSYPATTGKWIHGNTDDHIRATVFQVASVQTTAGFATADFDQWGLVAKGVLISLMFIGGCGGSTSGGLKVIRILSILKILYHELERSYRPQVVRTVKLGNRSLRDIQQASVLAYVLGIILIFSMATGALVFLEPNISGTTATMAAISAINNIGPGFAAIGPVENFGWFSDASKCLLILLMAIGRLEIFAVIAVVTPKFWRNN